MVYGKGNYAIKRSKFLSQIGLLAHADHKVLTFSGGMKRQTEQHFIYLSHTFFQSKLCLTYLPRTI